MKIKRYNSIGREEQLAVKKVIKNGILSDFVGSNSKKFLGGKNVQKFESQITKYFKVKYAITTNSWTSGLIAALGSMNIQPGDEVICTPWTMSACASSILHWNAIPVFVDIDKNTFNFNLDILKKKITIKTKAILAVDIFGQSENVNEIKKIIKNKKIFILSDSAQAIGAKYKGKYAGTFADISDTGSEWQWTCTSSLGADASCSADKGDVVCGPAAYNGRAYNGETYGSYDELETDACLPGYTIFKGDPGFCFTIADTGSTPYSSGGINSYECIANSEEYTSDCSGKTSGECTFFTDAFLLADY